MCGQMCRSSGKPWTPVQRQHICKWGSEGIWGDVEGEGRRKEGRGRRGRTNYQSPLGGRCGLLISVWQELQHPFTAAKQYAIKEEFFSTSNRVMFLVATEKQDRKVQPPPPPQTHTYTAALCPACHLCHSVAGTQSLASALLCRSCQRYPVRKPPSLTLLVRNMLP